MSIDARIAAFMPVAGSTAAAIVFLTTYRTGELRALLGDNSSTEWLFLREAVICTLLPLLTTLLVVFGLDLALDSLGELTGKHGFSSPQAGFVLFMGLLLVVLTYQFFLALTAWAQWSKKRANT